MKRAITGTTKLLGLLGYPISHSKSPRMHNLAFLKLGMDYVYLTFDVWEDNLEDAVKAMRTLNVKGFNVTMPNKKNILPLLDELSPEAQLIGAVNTVKNENGKFTGYNTDGMGYVQLLRDNKVDFKGKKMVICGAGGAGRAVAIQLALEGVKEIVLFDVIPEATNDTCNTINKNILGCRAIPYLYDEERLKTELQDAFMLINCTGLGMHPNEGASVISTPDTLPSGLIVSDIIYDPDKTRLLEMAEQKGCKTFNGLDMMFWQGAFAFKIWTGVDMPVAYVKEQMLVKDVEEAKQAAKKEQN